MENTRKQGFHSAGGGLLDEKIEHTLSTPRDREHTKVKTMMVTRFRNGSWHRGLGRSGRLGVEVKGVTLRSPETRGAKPVT